MTSNTLEHEAGDDRQARLITSELERDHESWINWEVEMIIPRGVGHVAMSHDYESMPGNYLG
jgi:hypothetical protein